jgi:hypothetical protein
MFTSLVNCLSNARSPLGTECAFPSYSPSKARSSDNSTINTSQSTAETSFMSPSYHTFFSSLAAPHHELRRPYRDPRVLHIWKALGPFDRLLVLYSNLDTRETCVLCIGVYIFLHSRESLLILERTVSKPYRPQPPDLWDKSADFEDRNHRTTA